MLGMSVMTDLDWTEHACTMEVGVEVYQDLVIKVM